jgi:hypothetical protein
MSFVGGKIVGRDAEARVYQAAHFGWFYIFDGLTSDSFASEQEAIADVKTWKDQCTIWCRSHNLTAPYSVREFVAAAVACGVKYSPLENFPHDLAIGVAHYGRIVRGEWRAVLQNGPAEPVRR